MRRCGSPGPGQAPRAPRGANAARLGAPRLQPGKRLPGPSPPLLQRGKLVRDPQLAGADPQASWPPGSPSCRRRPASTISPPAMRADEHLPLAADSGRSRPCRHRARWKAGCHLAAPRPSAACTAPIAGCGWRSKGSTGCFPEAARCTACSAFATMTKRPGKRWPGMTERCPAPVAVALLVCRAFYQPREILVTELRPAELRHHGTRSPGKSKSPGPGRLKLPGSPRVELWDLRGPGKAGSCGRSRS